jgi:hypothetical protein
MVLWSLSNEILWPHSVLETEIEFYKLGLHVSGDTAIFSTLALRKVTYVYMC